MNIRQLRYFISAADNSSLSAAARLLHVSQPALGQQIRELEEEVGLELLIRHTRGVALTPAGEVLREHAIRVFDQLEQAHIALLPFRNPVNAEITCGSPPAPGRLLLPELVMAAHAQSNIRITSYLTLSDELMRLMESDEFDVALGYDFEHLPTARPLYQEYMYLVGPSDLVCSDDPPIPFDQLSGFRLVLDRRMRGTRRIIDDVARQREVDLDVSFDVESVELKREFMLRHSCCTIVFYGTYVEAIEAGELGARLIIEPTIPRLLSIVFRPDLNDSVRLMLTQLIRRIVETKIAEGRLNWQALR